MTISEELSTIHESYKHSLNELHVEMRFWHHFVSEWAIPEYQRQFGSRRMNASIYNAYDNSPLITQGYLKTGRDIHEIHSQNLSVHSDHLFNWVMNMALVRAYNSLEILLLKAINAAYLHLNTHGLSIRKEMNQINAEVSKVLPKGADKTNNRHLIQFLNQNCSAFQSWSQLPMRNDLPATWEDFFDLLSVLRHCIVHQAMLIHTDTLNAIQSQTCGDLFSRYYHLALAGANVFELKPVQDSFDNLIQLAIELAVNTLKFVANEHDLDFLGLMDT